MILADGVAEFSLVYQGFQLLISNNVLKNGSVCRLNRFDREGGMAGSVWTKKSKYISFTLFIITDGRHVAKQYLRVKI